MNSCVHCTLAAASAGFDRVRSNAALAAFVLAGAGYVVVVEECLRRGSNLRHLPYEDCRPGRQSPHQHICVVSLASQAGPASLSVPVSFPSSFPRGGAEYAGRSLYWPVACHRCQHGRERRAYEDGSGLPLGRTQGEEAFRKQLAYVVRSQ